MENFDRQLELMGYCAYCKHEIFDDEDHVKKNGKVWHAECYDIEYEVHEELDFDEE